MIDHDPRLHGDPRHHTHDIEKLKARVAQLEKALRCGIVITHLGQVNLELRQRLAMHQRPTRPAPVCETCDCPLVLGGEAWLCRTCSVFDWLAH